MKAKKVGKVIAIFLLIVLVMALGYLVYTYFYGGTREQKIERKLKKMAKSFYEDYYYDLLVEQKGSNDQAIVYLSNFADTGLKISFDSLKLYYDENAKMNYTELADCNENATKVIIYPKSPYGNKDYTMKVQLACDLVETTEDMKKFKKEYEGLNNVDNKKEIKVDENNLIKYSSLEEVNKMIKDNKSFVVFFGSPYYDESRYTINEFIKATKDNGIDTIYYVDIIKDGKEENDIRTKYTLDNGTVTKTKEGSNDYVYFVTAAQEILPIPYEGYIDANTYEGEKTILNSAYIYVENGVPTIYTTGLPSDTQDYTLVSESTITQLFKDFYNKRKAN